MFSACGELKSLMRHVQRKDIHHATGQFLSTQSRQQHKLYESARHPLSGARLIPLNRVEVRLANSTHQPLGVSLWASRACTLTRSVPLRSNDPRRGYDRGAVKDGSRGLSAATPTGKVKGGTRRPRKDRKWLRPLPGSTCEVMRFSGGVRYAQTTGYRL